MLKVFVVLFSVVCLVQMAELPEELRQTLMQISETACSGNPAPDQVTLITTCEGKVPLMV